MNGLHDSFYRVLGLAPGASPSDIKAAYRRMAKNCHPDRNKSPDAEARFRDIRTAYETLRDWHLAGGMPPPAGGYESPKRTTWVVKDWAWTPKDWTTEYDVDMEELVYNFEKSAERIPFSLVNLPAIFMASLKELANWGVVLQVILAAFFISASYGPDHAVRYGQRSHLPHAVTSEALQAKPYKNLVRAVGLISGLAVVVLRYYVTLRRKGVLFCAFIVLSYATAVTLLVRRFYPGVAGLSAVWACFYLASMILAFNPLGAMSEPVGYLLRSLFRRR